MTNQLSSFLGRVGRWYLPPSLFKKYPPSIKIFSLAPFLRYLMLALINPVYLLLKDKTNGAGTLMIIKGNFNDQSCSFTENELLLRYFSRILFRSFRRLLLQNTSSNICSISKQVVHGIFKIIQNYDNNKINN